ncbi:MAG TPA: HPr(Ser) kinase/phosphatase [Tissierellaceae bacterium]
MSNNKYVKLNDIINDLNLEIVYSSSQRDFIKIYSSEIYRPGLQMIGFFEKFVPERIQIIGYAEWNYLLKLDKEERYKRLDEFFSYPIPAFIVARDLEVFDELREVAKKHDRTILRTEMNTSQLINRLVHYIDVETAMEMQTHGVLVEVYGVGVLIKGKSGVGKSETALDLVIRGHRLISDDIVIIKKVDNKLLGRSPEITRHFMEIRGLGILDIERLYGVGSVKNDENIELVIDLELWDKTKEYDRLGLEEDFEDIMGVKVAKTTVPVRPGRNVAMIIEVAARNFRQRRLGYNAAFEFNERIRAHIQKNKDKSK